MRRGLDGSVVEHSAVSIPQQELACKTSHSEANAFRSPSTHQRVSKMAQGYRSSNLKEGTCWEVHRPQRTLGGDAMPCCLVSP